MREVQFFQCRHSPPVSLHVQQTGAFCAGKPCLKRELYGIAHEKFFAASSLQNFSVKDNVVKMPYGGSKFRLRFFGTIMLTPCKANLAGRFMYLSCGVNFSTNPSFTSSPRAGEPRLRHKIICKYAPPRAKWPWEPRLRHKIICKYARHGPSGQGRRDYETPPCPPCLKGERRVYEPRGIRGVEIK